MYLVFYLTGTFHRFKKQSGSSLHRVWSYLPLMRRCPLLSAWCSRHSLYEIELQTPQANQTSPSIYLCAGTASVAIKHTQQHSSCLQTCCRTSSIFYRCVCWQLIALKTHHRWNILAIKLGHLPRQRIDIRWKLECQVAEMFLFSPTNEATNLEAVLVGLQNRVDLWGCENVAAEQWGRMVTSRVKMALPITQGRSRVGLVTDGLEQGLVLLAW